MIQEGQVLAVFRLCQRCRRWRSLGSFGGTHRRATTCTPCYHAWRYQSRTKGFARARSLVLTEQGRAAVRDAA